MYRLVFYLMLSFIGMLFAGLPGAGAIFFGLYALHLWRYQFRYLGARDQRFFLFRIWRKAKLSLYQPTFCIFAALAIVTLLSFIISPLAYAKIWGADKEIALAQQIGSWQNKFYTATEWLDGAPLLGIFLFITGFLLVINLVWPNLNLLDKAPRIRARIRGILIFITTLSCFSYVSSSSIEGNRSLVTATLRSDLIEEEDEIQKLHTQAAAMRMVIDEIENLDNEETKKLALAIRAIAAAESASDLAKELGNQAGQKKAAQMKRPPASKPVPRYDHIKDWAELAEIRANTTDDMKRAKLVRKAAHDALNIGVDQLGRDMATHLGQSWSKFPRTVFGEFFSAMSNAFYQVCSDFTPDGKLKTQDDLLQSVKQANPDINNERAIANWLDEAIPAGTAPDRLNAAFEKKVANAEVDLSARKAAKAAASADDAAKAGKAAKTILKVLF